MNRMIVVTVDKCLGCKSCELACALEHSSVKDLTAAVLSGERASPMLSVTACRGSAVPIHCGHCDESPCSLVCPTGAISRKSPDDAVIVDAELCIGCRMCVQACPFGVIVMNPEGKGAVKCDLCAERLGRGQEPACSAACPSGALEFRDVDSAVKQKRREAAERMLDGQAQKEAVQK